MVFFYEHMKNKKTNFMFSGQNKNYLDFLNENQIMKINLGFKKYIEEYSTDIIPSISIFFTIFY